MRRHSGAAGLVGAVLSSVTVGIAVFASGCGTTAASDPFTGSWSVSGQAPADAVIFRASDGYRAAVVIDGRTTSTLFLKRQGERLEATVSAKGPPAYSWNVVVERRDGSDRLFWVEGGGTTPLSRVSDNTAFPTPLPTSH